MKPPSLLLLLLPLTLLPLTISSTSPSCNLVSGAPALCVTLQKCTHLINLIANLQRPLPRDVSLLIKESFFCSSDQGAISVCCPLDGLSAPAPTAPSTRDSGRCQLQHDRPAECVLFNECSPVTQMLANLVRPLHKDVPKIMKSTYLCGFDETSGKKLPKVCCPTDALKRLRPTSAPTAEPTTAATRYAQHPGRSKLEDLETCGLSMWASPKRIVGGEDAKLGQFPWLVNLGYSRSGRSGTVFKCGGTLIGSRYVLTAAHCVTGLPPAYSLSVVRAGEHDLSKEKDCAESGPGRSFGPVCSDATQDMTIEKIIWHEEYDKPERYQNDIAVIKLADDVVVNDFVSPVCLPWLYDQDEDYLKERIDFDGEEFEITTDVAGWGATSPNGRNPANILQYLGVKVMENEKCKQIYATRGGILTDKQICAGGEKKKDSCVGDSGSGLMRTDPRLLPGFDKWMLVGVVSFGPRFCGTEGVPGVYSRVQSYLDWILETVHKN